MITAELTAAIDRLIDEALAAPQEAGRFPPRADAATRALLVHATDALLCYYLTADGTVYERDLDQASARLERVTDPAQIAAALAAAARAYPALRALAAPG